MRPRIGMFLSRIDFIRCYYVRSSIKKRNAITSFRTPSSLSSKLKLAPLAVAAAVLLCVASPGLACVCRGAEEPPCISYQKASAVFVGTVTGESAIAEGQTREKLVLVAFTVEDALKGVVKGNVEISTAAGTDCDLEFKIGKRYFVYAYQIGQTQRLITGACTRTRDLSSAKEDLDYIQELTRSGPKTVLLGTDGAGPGSLLAEAEIIVEGHEKRLTTRSNNKGDFSIELPGAGSYRVTMIAPAGIELLTYTTQLVVYSANGRSVVELERTVGEGKCDFVDLSLLLTVRKTRKD